MDTKKDSATADVPTFKLARVGKDRKRKGGAFSFLRSGGARGVWSGAAGGSGASAVGGVAFSKALLSIVIACLLGVAGVQMGKMQSAGDNKAKPAEKKFGQEKRPVAMEGDTSNLPASANSIPNSLGYLSGSMDGLTPEERAKKAADAAAAAEAQRVADEAAAKKAEADAAAAAAAGKPGMDPAALLAAAQADGGKGDKGGKDGAFGKKFGALSSSMGGGSSLSGGAGMSGGVGQKFGSASMGKGAGGQLSGSRAAARPTSSASARAAIGKSNAKGFARKQLANANAFSRRAASAGAGETAAYDAGSAFGNNTGASNVISGPGISNGGNPSGANSGGANPTSGGGPVQSFNPTPTTTPCTKTGYFVNSAGACVPIPTVNGTNVTSWQWAADLAQTLLIAIAALAVIAFALQYMGWLAAVAAAIKVAICILGGIVSALGLYIIAETGDIAAGGMFALVGAFICYMAWPAPNALAAAPAVVPAAAASESSTIATQLATTFLA